MKFTLVNYNDHFLSFIMYCNYNNEIIQVTWYAIENEVSMIYN